MREYLSLFLAGLLILCLFDMPYGYYQLVRFIGMLSFGFLAFQSYGKNQTWLVIWIASSVLINPILKISLGRELWNIVDVIWAAMLVYSFFNEKIINGKN